MKDSSLSIPTKKAGVAAGKVFLSDSCIPRLTLVLAL